MTKDIDPVTNELVILLKDYLVGVEFERKKSKDLLEQLKQATVNITECSFEMKTQIKAIQQQAVQFSKTFKKQTIECSVRQNRIETHLKFLPSKEVLEIRDEERTETKKKVEDLASKIPSEELTEKRDKELEYVKKKLDDLLPRLYTAIAVCTGTGCIIGLSIAFVFKTVFK